MLKYKNQPEDNQPIIVQWINQLANLYSSRQFTCFYDKHHKALPWIPHTMVTQVQIIISSLAKISKSYLHQNALKNQKLLHASILRSALRTFNDVIDDIKSSIRGSGLGCITTPHLIHTSNKTLTTTNTFKEAHHSTRNQKGAEGGLSPQTIFVCPKTSTAGISATFLPRLTPVVALWTTLVHKITLCFHMASPIMIVR